MLKRTFAIFLALMMGLSLLVITPGAQAADYDWVDEGDMPDDLSGFVSVELPNGTMFVAFGWDDGVREDNAWLFDPVNLTWTPLADAPINLMCSTGAYLNGRVYVFGGVSDSYVYVDTVLIYDLETDAWSASQDLPNTGVFMSSVAVDDENILVIGGDLSSGFASDECYMFNVDTEVFNPVAALPDSRAGGGMARMGDTVYYFGGWDHVQNVQDEIFAYDIPSDNWTVVGHLPKALAGMTAVAASNGLVYLLGGGPSVIWYDPDNVDDVQAWNPDDGQFSRLPDMPGPLRYMAAFQVGSRIVYFGGHDENTGNDGIYSLETLRMMAEVTTPTVQQGDSLWIRVWVESEMEVHENLYGSLYLVQGNTSWGHIDFLAAEGNEAFVEIPLSEGMPAGDYEVVSYWANIDGWDSSWILSPMSFTVTEAPSDDEIIEDLQEQLDALHDELNNTREELDDAIAAKQGAIIGYVILIVALGALIVGVFVLVRKK